MYIHEVNKEMSIKYWFDYPTKKTFRDSADSGLKTYKAYTAKNAAGKFALCMWSAFCYSLDDSQHTA